MATRRQVEEQVKSGADYVEIGARLGISPGLAYLIATGLSADGSDVPSSEALRRPGAMPSSQHLANPVSPENPTASDTVRAWIRGRVACDAQMRSAAASQGE